MPLYNLISIIIVLAAGFSYVNFRWIRLPGAIGIMIISLLASLLIFATRLFEPDIFRHVAELVERMDFNTALMKVMLGFLLFAGAMHIDTRQLKKERASVIVFSTIGVAISTFAVAALMYGAASLFGLSVPFIYWLLFGALISPTDPIAVLGILKQADIPASLEMKITGESLFNDGVAVVVFITILDVVMAGTGKISFGQVALLFMREAGGGLLFGWVLGYLGFLALRSVDNYVVELLITLAIVMGGNLLAEHLHVSGPLAMVVAGIVTGNKSTDLGMSDTTRDYLSKFWEMVDEVLNAILFMLIGFEMLIVRFNLSTFWLGCLAILIVLAARFISVSIPMAFLKFSRTFEKNAVQILTWGGLRGGISVALALSLPAGPYKEMFVSVTYLIVLFSIIVQGLTIGKVAKKLLQ